MIDSVMQGSLCSVFPKLDLIYLGLTRLWTHFIGFITTGSFKGRGNQDILVGLDSALSGIHKQILTFSHWEGSGFEIICLGGGRQVSYPLHHRGLLFQFEHC